MRCGRYAEGPHQWRDPSRRSLLVATLVTRLAQLAVLLLRHALAALLNDGAHGVPPSNVGAAG